jgi:hypothetical protein
MRWLTVFLAAIAFALVGVGCGGSDESAVTTDTTVQEETTTDETTTDEGTTQASDLSFTSKDCLAFIGAAAAAGQAFSGVEGSDQPDILDQYADRVPDDIKADFQTLADGGAAAAAAYAKMNLAPGETPSATQLQQYQADLGAIDQEEFSAASERISAWTTEVCPSG